MNQPVSESADPERGREHDRNFAYLCRTPNIEVRCIHDRTQYVTTGKGTVLDKGNGKEYPLYEDFVERQSGRDIFMTYINFEAGIAPVIGSERVNIAPPQKPPTIDQARICKGIHDGTMLPTREEVQQALTVFHEGKHPDKLMDFCLEHELYEILTKEYVEMLATYLEERIRLLREQTGKDVTILEVGAGDGRLTHFLQEELGRRGVTGYRIIATDAMGGQWRIPPRYPVQKEVADMALWDFEPQIVLACWMPRNEDWTGQIRGTPSVEEYILIGPKDSGTCGLDDETWGMNQESAQTRYRREGFERVELSELSALQMGQKDRDAYRYSATVSFRRLPKDGQDK